MRENQMCVDCREGPLLFSAREIGTGHCHHCAHKRYAEILKAIRMEEQIQEEIRESDRECKERSKERNDQELRREVEFHRLMEQVRGKVNEIRLSTTRRVVVKIPFMLEEEEFVEMREFIASRLPVTPSEVMLMLGEFDISVIS